MRRTFPRNHPAKRRYHDWVELRPRTAAELRNSVILAYRIAVRALGRHGVEGVADGHDARPKRDVVPAQAVRIAAAVPALVARANQARDGAKRRRGEQDALADQRMAPHEAPLDRIERAGLVEDGVGHRDLPHVVE